MATELPFYKFEIMPYFTGDICLERWELRGIFFDICAFYWSKNCDLTLVSLQKKYDGYHALIQELIDLDILKVDEEYLSINFLNEQWASKETQKIVNTINGKKGGRPKKEQKPIETENKPNGLFFANQNETNIDKKREDNNREDNNSVLSEEQEIVFNDICTFFEYNDTNFKNQRYLIQCFVFSLPHKNKHDFFVNEFASYKKLKTIDGYKHSLNNFLGNQDEQFLNGKWDDNWTQKLKDYQIKNGIQEPTSTVKKETALQKHRRLTIERNGSK